MQQFHRFITWRLCVAQLLIDTITTTRVPAVAYHQNLEKTELQLRETYLICARII